LASLFNGARKSPWVLKAYPRQKLNKQAGGDIKGIQSQKLAMNAAAEKELFQDRLKEGEAGGSHHR
jgi:hypothetical protein